MKKKLANLAAAIRRTRKRNVLVFIAGIWIALLVGFVGASWMKPEAGTNVWACPRQSSIPVKGNMRNHRSQVRDKIASKGTSTVTTIAPCSALAVRSQERSDASPVAPATARSNGSNLSTSLIVRAKSEQGFKPFTHQ